MRPPAEAIRAALPCLLLALSPTRPAAAHDIWLQAESFTLARGDTLVVRQLFSAELESDLGAEKVQEFALMRDMTSRFDLLTAAGSVDLLAELPDPPTRRQIRPVLERTLDFDGFALVTMDHSILYTESTNEEFFRYLEHEGLERGRFVEEMGSRPVQTEGYQRTLKALVRVGEPAGAASAAGLHGRVVGQKLEIVLLQNPYLLDPGEELEARVLLHGEPLADQLVHAYRAGGGGPVSGQTSRTGADGVARFRLDRGGLWLIRLVHLAPCSERSGVDCQDTAWESYWTAYSFAVD